MAQKKGKIVALRYPRLGRGIEALKIALETLELTDKERATVSAILASNLKKFQTVRGTKSTSGGTSKPNKQQLAGEIQKEQKQAAMDVIKEQLGFSTPTLEFVTNPRPLPGGCKK